ncbi:MAG: MBOAT family protein [Phycisphaerales bacterium]|nr:MBOAT family protein [Phycisphaerales bacterium]
MVFSSVAFLFWFLPATLLLFHAAPARVRLPVLLAASLAFYFYGENWLIWVMLASTGIDYVCALMIAGSSPSGSVAVLPAHGPRTPWQRGWLAVSIASNLALLGYFKYFDFFVENAIRLLDALRLGHLGLDGLARVALPLGISFYTFQSMSYTIDVYRGRVAANRSLLEFSTFVTMFPQLVAGPIVRYSDIEGQLRSPGRSVGEFAEGVRRFIGGLAKKVLIANPMALVADRAFALPEQDLTWGIAWAGLAAYTLQIYFDFSGYSCMAIGLGRMFGFRFPENFDFPYVATSVREFWHRWHMTLSTWFRDYVYFPLGGSRGSEAATWRNLLIVFVACGLWHGASWNFVAWGLFHGLFISMERTALGRVVSRVPRPLRHAYLMLVVMVGWVLFRCDTLSHGLSYAAALLPHASTSLRTARELLPNESIAVLAIGAAFCAPVVPWLRARVERLGGHPRLAAELAWTAALFGLLVLSAGFLASGSYNPFIYFRF